MALVTASSVAMLSIFNHFERGVMPVSGGLFDQPALAIEAMDVIFAARALARKD